MDPINATVIALVVGASELSSSRAIDAATKDAYASLKMYLREQYTDLDIDKLEARPDSNALRELFVEGLRNTAAVDDPELAYRAKGLLEILIKRPEGAIKVGVKLADLEAARVQLESFLSAGSGISISGVSNTGNISIGRIRVGIEPVDPWPLPGKSQG